MKDALNKIAIRTGQCLLGIVLGLLVAEAIFWTRDAGAFPHVNFYQADKELGVRLMPNASMRFRLPGDPVSKISVNSEGYRGDDFPEPAAGEILVVGDSQVFGLGVNDDETFSTRLANLTKKTVINAGVPTYGPIEYLKVAEELASKRKPATVIAAINFANDIFEYSDRNPERHQVWDGWAVEYGTAPKTIVPFPGRRILFAKSHAVFAFRKFWHATHLKRAPISTDATSNTSNQRDDSFSTDILTDTALDRPLGPAVSIATRARRETRETARDIVYCDENAECAGPVDQVAYRISRAASDLQKIEIALADYNRSPRMPRSSRTPWSGSENFLGKFQELGLKYKFKPIVLLLPLDVQVSSEEWKKYGVNKPIDMSPTLILLRDLGNRARKRKMQSLDLTAALLKAEPGAFLAGDLHMTPKGHDAVARAISDFLKARGN